MKLTKLALALMISASCLFAPMKKAEAGFVIGVTGAPAAGLLYMFGGAALGFASPLFENMSEKINMGGVAFLAGVAIIILDSKSDALSSNMAKEFPTIPEYIIHEVAEVVKEKAALIPFNPEGVKAVTLTASEVAEIEAAMPLDVSAKDLAGFKALLATEVAL